MTTSAHSSRRRVQLTLFAVDFPARTSPMPAPVLVSVRAPGAGFSTSSCVSFAWWDRDSWSWRTSQRSLIEGWTSFSENWPKQGLMRNGLASRRVMWAPAISVIGGGALPTPKANSAMTVDLRTQQNRPELQPNLETVMSRMLPTPTSALGLSGGSNWEAAGRHGQQRLPDCLPTGPGTHLNPSFVEEMMGFPVGWTA